MDTVEILDIEVPCESVAVAQSGPVGTNVYVPGLVREEERCERSSLWVIVPGDGSAPLDGETESPLTVESGDSGLGGWGALDAEESVILGGRLMTSKPLWEAICERFGQPYVVYHGGPCGWTRAGVDRYATPQAAAQYVQEIVAQTEHEPDPSGPGCYKIVGDADDRYNVTNDYQPITEADDPDMA